MDTTFAIAAALTGLLAGSALASAGSRPESPASTHPDMAFQGVRLWQFKAGALTGTGSAEALVYRRGAGEIEARQVRAALFGSRGTSQPVKVETAAARCDTRSQHLTGSDPVRVRGQNLDLTGKGFAYDLRGGELELDGPVEASGEARP